MKTAIIGTGISGLGTAFLLNPHHDIILYEKNPSVGGHSRTISINCDGQTIPVDTGFIVFNNWNYPNLLGLFNLLNVPYVKSDMSFGISINKGWLEYSSNDLLAFRNLARPDYWRMLRDILTFNKAAPSYLEKDPDLTLGQCLDELKAGPWFRDYYILAMGAAIWSCPADKILSFPARSFIQFFKNHGLLNLINRPQWYTVKGGSVEYIKRLTAPFKDKIKLDCGVKSVARQKGKWKVTDINGGSSVFDQVVFACHADEALRLLSRPTRLHKDIIGAFSYETNKIIAHSDKSFLPKHRKSWASWVYLADKTEKTESQLSVSYWMNNLQPLECESPVIVTLNPARRPQTDLIYDEHLFTHPVFDHAAVHAQTRLDEIQGKDGLWFCGAYQANGFHEDGLLSAVRIAEKMGITVAWH